MITPVIINVGGGSCDLGMRERWTCPACMSVIYRKGCFVATTTYGDEDIVEVRFLRAFRDEILQEAGAGRVLIKAYYRWGPLAAQWVEAVPGLKRVARWSLDRVISGIEAFTELRRDRFRS
jgi:hypothetical protein